MRSSRTTRAALQSSSSSRMASYQSSIDEGSNIRVVTRCRGRNDRETKANSPIVVDTTSASQTEVSVRTGDDLTGNRTYTLDRVFGAEADQQMIFDEVISPVMEDLLSGMNCTVFAYGQTGTGKTYTMSGDDSLSHDSYAHDAGIIPRVLFRLFSALEDKKDHSVTCSFIELYNEELRDLLDPGDGKKVRIFDDSAKKTVMVQGLTDNHITSATNGLKVLQTGLRKRHVAATKINDYSSRSHTIFTLNVAIDSYNGECLRSKINLVDLAGSENVGKSGAENKRAREAGMINQSLLTLGRVINSLVDKSPHVPYRESKLTRLLQDSLGGRTKTCIIATISPAMVNVEETLSTLEYASRAKNIKNKPQVNSTIPKKSLLKDYAAEMERLRQDLAATRKKNGIYMDSENYKEMMADKESQSILVKDQQRRLETVDEQLKSTRDLVENTKIQLKQVNKELESSSHDLGKTMASLNITEGQLRTSRNVVLQATGGTKLPNDLLDTVNQTINDVNDLMEKINQKQEFDRKAQGVIKQSSTDITSSVERVEGQLRQYSSKHSTMSVELQRRLQSIADAELAKISSASDFVLQSLNNLDTMTEGLKKSTGDSETNLKTMFDNVDHVRDDIKSRVRDGLKTLMTSANSMCSSLQLQMSSFQQDIQQPVDSIIHLLKDSMATQQQQHDKQRKELQELLALMDQSSKHAESQYQQQIETLKTCLEKERSQSAVKRQQLMSQMSALVNEYAESESRIESAVSQVMAPSLSNKPETKVKQIIDEGQKSFQSVSETTQSLSQQLATVATNVNGQQAGITRATDQFQADTAATIEQQVGAVEQNIQALDQFLDGVAGQNRQHGELVTGQVASVCGSFHKVLDSLKHTLDDMQEGMQRNTADVDISDNDWSGTEKFTLECLDKIRTSVHALAYLQPATANPRKRRHEDDDRMPLNELTHAENLPIVEDKKTSSSSTSNTTGVPAPTQAPSRVTKRLRQR